MATPIGHAAAGMLAGACVARGRPLLGPRADLVLFAAIAQAPDLDFIPGLVIGRPDLFHHGISHSLGFALFAGGLFFAWGARRGDGPRWGLAAFAIYFLQVLIDAVTLDTRPPVGVPLWWPLSHAWVEIYPFFDDVWRTAPWLATLLHNLRAVALELLVLGPPLLAALFWRQRAMARARGESGSGADGLKRAASGRGAGG